MYRDNPLKARLAAGRKCLGAWTTLASPAVTEILALAGYDFIIIDFEHGPGEFQTLCNQLRAITGTVATSILRVPGHDPDFINTALDHGIEGLMVPDVRTAEEARAIVAACRYPPAGIRGSAYPIARGASYGVDAERYLRTVNDNLAIICQIESVTGIDNIDEIASVEGIDVLFLGLHDLSGTVAHLGEPDHPEVLALVERFESGVRASDKHLGSIPQPGRSCQDLFDAGYALAAGASDIMILMNAARADVEAHRRRND
jgi:4-hydroxy-2-oxoheptanedioate aldolase